MRAFLIGLPALAISACSNPQAEAPSAAAPTEAVETQEAAEAEQGEGALTSAVLSVEGVEREYILYAPAGHDREAPTPLIVMLHGLGSHNEQQMTYTGFNALAEREGVLAVYPQGLPGEVQGVPGRLHWDAQFGTGTNDIGFLRALVAELEAVYGADPGRTYITGFFEWRVHELSRHV